jgi:hypothetical protein
VYSIQAQYGTIWAPIRGAANGLQGAVQAFTLNADEVITAVYLASSNTGCNCVCYIKMETSNGRTLGPVDAGCGAGAASRYPVGNGLSYLSGRGGNNIDALALNYCSGKCTGSEYDDAITLESRLLCFVFVCTTGKNIKSRN